ncbi:MAG: DMT family transporter [Rhodospirillaceae bacterium]|nr:DMT family transporter [Rhodospirillaceae bacterium]
MAALIKFIGQRIPVFEILFVRQLCVLVVLAPVIARTHRTIFKTKVLRFHLMRGGFAAIAMATGFTALVHLPLAEATAISFARTLFMTLLAIVFLREAVGIRRWSVTIIGFIGVMIIIRPDADNVNVYALLALLSSLFVAGIIIVLKMLSSTEPPSTIMTYQSVMVTAVMAGPAIYLWVMPTWPEVALIVVIGGLMSMMQWVMIQGLKAAEAVAVAPVEYARLLFVTIIGIVFFNEIPTAWTIAGSAIIIGSTLYTIRRNAMRKQRGDGA